VTISQNSEKLWYLSLRRNIDNLHALRKKIEDKLIPAMINDAKSLQSANTALLNDNELAKEITRRKKLYEEWNKRYTDEFIPFAHGMRLFGQVYNDRVKPSNPYEFMDLLSGSEMLSIKRNKEINRLAGILRNDASLMDKARNGAVEGDFAEDFEKLFRDFGHSGIFRTRENLLTHIIKLASNPEKEKQDQKDISELERSFISALEKEEKSFAEELLEIARISYRLRDDDNIHLGRIEHQYLLSLNEAKMRIAARSDKPDPADDFELDELIKALRDSAYIPEKKVRISKENVVLDQRKTVRQIQGQPAGEGLVTGRARVITENEELFNIRYGEIMVCDSIDPNMTFVVPLVSGIVERRGGMLIHGAIIAREYGIPCVTGIPEATRIVTNGDEVTVDGYLGIVTIRKNERKKYP
jgi:pyruvate,water dikinase